MIQKKKGLFCAHICKQEGEQWKKKKKKKRREAEKKRDLTSALLEMGFLWMGELTEG